MLSSSPAFPILLNLTLRYSLTSTCANGWTAARTHSGLCASSPKASSRTDIFLRLIRRLRVSSVRQGRLSLESRCAPHVQSKRIPVLEGTVRSFRHLPLLAAIALDDLEKYAISTPWKVILGSLISSLASCIGRKCSYFKRTASGLSLSCSREGPRLLKKLGGCTSLRRQRT
jgi:hypothetical protein